MKLINKHKNLELIISENFIQKLNEYGNNHFPKEFGGFLIGYYSDNFRTLYITDSILPKKYNSFKYLFERNTKGIKNIFSQIFQSKKQYYVGEWHTHPNGTSMYSKTDLNAMIKIADNDKVQIKNPILLILSINKKGKIDFSIYIFDNQKLYKYEQ